MSDTTALLESIDRLSAALAVPHERKLWKVEDVAAYFDISPSTAYRCILCRPDFPEAIKISDGPKRWVAGEVMEWAESKRERRGRKAA